MSELVTGEAVALELRPAKLPSRALAVLLDLVVAGIAFTTASIGLALATASLDEAAQTAVAIATFLLVLVGGPIAVETLSHGRSLGKLACGLRVVRDDGGPIRFRHALVRGAVGVVEIVMTFGVIACIASLTSARGRRLGDVFAGTLVVRERVPAARNSVLPPTPPWLSERFSAVDLSAVPDPLWLAVRQYLTRMGQLDPQVGWSMGERLAVDLGARTGTPAPPGVPPAAYLAAMLHERQTREARRAFGAAQAASDARGRVPEAYGAPAGSPTWGWAGSPTGPLPPSHENGPTGRAADAPAAQRPSPRTGAPLPSAPVPTAPPQVPSEPVQVPSEPVQVPSEAGRAAGEPNGTADGSSTGGFAPPA